MKFIFAVTLIVGSQLTLACATNSKGIHADTNGFALSRNPAESGSKITVCSLGIGSDNSRDLFPDAIFAMRGRVDSAVPLVPLNKIPMVKPSPGGLSQLEIRSNLFIGRAWSRGSESGQKQIQLGVDIPGTGPVFVTNELSSYDETVTLRLDLTSSILAKKLGREYGRCDDEQNHCLSNVVYLTCGPQALARGFELFN